MSRRQRGLGVDPAPSSTTTADLGDAEVTVARWGEGPASLVLLHDGLGSIDQWRRIPAELAAATGRTVIAYDRPGHGQSTPIPAGPWPADWLHLEADRLGALLPLLDVEEPILVGHSDGGSIALIWAASTATADTAGPRIRGVVTLAAHSWVEQTCYDAIVAMRADPVPTIAGLARSHAKPAAVFEAWSGVWVGEAFGRWDIRPMLTRIACPTLVAQGRGDEYASDAHAIETAAAIGDNAAHVLLDGVGHLLHHQDPDLVVRVVADFARTLDA